MNSQQLAREGAWIVAGVMGACIIVLGIEAIVHDGELAQTITTQLIGVIQWAIPVLGGLVMVGQAVAAYQSKQTTPPPSTPPPLPMPPVENGPSNG